MTSRGADGFRLTILNPAGRDPEQRFDDPPGPADGQHPPINFHGFAACTRGVFHYDTQRAIAEQTPVLLLLRGEFRASERAFDELKKHGRKVAVSLKETGLHQIAQQLCDRGRLSRFTRILEQVFRQDGFVVEGLRDEVRVRLLEAEHDGGVVRCLHGFDFVPALA